jgi:hypothetical protein
LALDSDRFHAARNIAAGGGFRVRRSGYGTRMERTILYEDDPTEERLPTPDQREQNERALALDPDVTLDEDEEDEDEDEEDDEESEDLDD